MSDESSVKESDIDDGDEDDGDDLKITNTPLMKGLFEAICILWTVSDSQLKKVGDIITLLCFITFFVFKSIIYSKTSRRYVRWLKCS
jgi:hypothetical protein